jgi:hypothetical protein
MQTAPCNGRDSKHVSTGLYNIYCIQPLSKGWRELHGPGFVDTNVGQPGKKVSSKAKQFPVTFLPTWIWGVHLIVILIASQKEM